MTTVKQMYEHEKIRKLLVRISTPLVLSYLVAELYNMTDTFFVGNFSSASSVGGLMLVFPIQRLFIALAVLVSVGAATNISVKLGEGDRKAVHRQMHAADMMTLLVIPISILCFFARHEILRLFGGRGEILTASIQYMQIIIFSQFFVVRIMYLYQLGIACGQPGISVVSNLLGMGLNIIIDYITVAKLHMGVVGAGLGTLISQAVSYLYCEFAIQNLLRNNQLKTKKKIGPNREAFRLLFVVGLAGFLLEAEDGIVMGFINRMLLHVGGEEQIIILGVISKVYVFMFVLMFAIAEAMQPMAAYCHGRGIQKRVKRIFKETLLYSFVLDLFVYGIGMIFAETFIGIFIKDPDIIQKSIPAFRIMIAAFPITGFYYVMVHFLQSIEKSKKAIYLCVARQLFIRIPVSYVLMNIWGSMGIWLSFPISDILSVGVAYLTIRKHGKEKEPASYGESLSLKVQM
ncbi:MAG: MATE family efflux transporter [Tissierellia bacterium]|nr:MATE family efflux transporter [Tissierellia bacterium]